MSAEENHGILLASHLVPYFALDNEGQNPNLLSKLDHLDYNQFSETILVDTNGYTGTPLPETQNYDTKFEDIEKGVLEPEDAELLVEKDKDFNLIGGRPAICMNNSYLSLVEASRTYDKQINFRILTPYCFTGPGEGNLEDKLSSTKPDLELLNGLLSGYDFENTRLISEDPSVKNIENYLRQTQRMYRSQEALSQRDYSARFITESDRFQNYGSNQIHFKLEGGRHPSGSITGVEHYLGINNIFEELTEFKNDYSLEIKKQNSQDKLELTLQEGEFEISSKKPDFELEKVKDLLSEKAGLPIKV